MVEEEGEDAAVQTSNNSRGDTKALVQEISECEYVVSQNFLSLISSWR